MVVVEGCLTSIAQECYGRLTRWHCTAGDKVCQGLATHSAGVERVEHSIAVLKVALDGEVTARDNNDYNGLASGL